MPVITISRQADSLGDAIAQELSSCYQCPLIQHQDAVERYLIPIASESDREVLRHSHRLLRRPSPDGRLYGDILAERIRQLATDGKAVLLGFGAQAMLADHPAARHIRVVGRAVFPKSLRSAGSDSITADPDSADSETDSSLVADKSSRTVDRRRQRFVASAFAADWSDPARYDLVLNSSRLELEMAVRLIRTLTDPLMNRSERPMDAHRHDFANESEREFAAILDRYGIKWTYEPRTFPVEWNTAGQVTMAFRPDFYLNDYDTYIELTTMSQRYVTEKNKKIRRLRELYPGINVRIVYKQDFQSLAERFRHQGDG